MQSCHSSFKLQPIQELQNKLMPEILELIKQNRMNFLINGTRFNKFTSKSLVSASATTLKVFFCFVFVLFRFLSGKISVDCIIERLRYVLFRG